MKFIRVFMSGVTSVTDGVRFFYGNRDLWKYALLPWLLVLIFYILIFTGWMFVVNTLNQALQKSLESLPGWINWISYGVSTAGYLAGVAIAGILLMVLSSTVYELFGELFFDALIEKIFCKDSGVELPPLSWKANLRIVWDSLVYSMGTLMWMIAGLFISLIPLIGPALSFAILAYRFGIIYLSITAFRCGLTMNQTRARIGREWPAVLGYGSAINLCFMIPGAVFVLLPGIVAGGVLLCRKLDLLKDVLPVKNAE